MLLEVLDPVFHGILIKWPVLSGKQCGTTGIEGGFFAFPPEFKLTREESLMCQLTIPLSLKLNDAAVRLLLACAGVELKQGVRCRMTMLKIFWRAKYGYKRILMSGPRLCRRNKERVLTDKWWGEEDCSLRREEKVEPERYEVSFPTLLAFSSCSYSNPLLFQRSEGCQTGRSGKYG